MLSHAWLNIGEFTKEPGDSRRKNSEAVQVKETSQKYLLYYPTTFY